MRFASSLRRASLAWMVMQACATYDDIPTNPGGGGAGAGGVSAMAGSLTGGGSSTNAGSSGAGAGHAGTESGGAPTEGGAASPPDGMGGGGHVAGSPPNLGGVGGASGEAGAAEAGAAGAGGSVAACITAAPDIGCTCELYNAHEYWFCNQYLTFAAAENKCKSVKMHLPKIETQAEDDWLFAAAQAYLLGEYFLGATDASTPDEWSWLAGGKFWSGVADGTATGYAHWSANEPNASGDCLVVQGNGPWDDRTCTDQRRYVCESP